MVKKKLNKKNIRKAKIILKQKPKIATCKVINAPSSNLGKASKI